MPPCITVLDVTVVAVGTAVRAVEVSGEECGYGVVGTEATFATGVEGVYMCCRWSGRKRGSVLTRMGVLERGE